MRRRTLATGFGSTRIDVVRRIREPVSSSLNLREKRSPVFRCPCVQCRTRSPWPWQAPRGHGRPPVAMGNRRRGRARRQRDGSRGPRAKQLGEDSRSGRRQTKWSRRVVSESKATYSRRRSSSSRITGTSTAPWLGVRTVCRLYIGLLHPPVDGCSTTFETGSIEIRTNLGKERPVGGVGHRASSRAEVSPLPPEISPRSGRCRRRDVPDRTRTTRSVSRLGPYRDATATRRCGTANPTLRDYRRQAPQTAGGIRLAVRVV